MYKNAQITSKIYNLTYEITSAQKKTENNKNINNHNKTKIMNFL